MNREEFKKMIGSTPLILDGATGSHLQRAGMPSGVCPEKWIVDHRDVLINLQHQYIEAGSNIIYTSTFTGNRIKLKEYGLESDIKILNQELVLISKEAAGGKALVAGDITMTGEQLYPMGDLDFEELIDIYKEQIQYLVEAGVDLLVVETMMSLQETRAALIAAREVCDLPVMATLTFNEEGRTLYGTDPATAVVVLQGLGADAIGANCSTGPDKMVSVIRTMKEYAVVPIIAKPNAGLPYLDENNDTAYDMDADTFVNHMLSLIEAGANIVGGCCGTNPEYISKLAEKASLTTAIPPLQKKRRTVSSDRKTIDIKSGGKVLIIGEKINPTGKKAMQAEIRNKEYNIILDYAEQQTEDGAALLDINVGMNGIDEKETMLEVIMEVNASVGTPLCIDTSHIDVMEAALRVYPGRALINSISLEEGKMESLLPLAKKYGAMFILLPLSSKGLPEDMKERFEIIHTIMDEALSIGLEKEDMIVDGLVATIGANKNAALEALETIKYCNQTLQLGTVIGLANISFGLPERSYVNHTFFTMGIQNGLTMAIANPSNTELMSTAYAADLLMNKHNADIAYIRFISKHKGKSNKDTKILQPTDASSDTQPNAVYEEVVNGSRKTIVDTVRTCLAQGNSPSDILDNMLIPGINEVSRLFDRQIYFLPQLIASAEAMKNAINYLEPMLYKDEQSQEKPVIVMATVKGDIHDIGKNLVVMMLKNYGYRVIDLGKDVPRELIVQTAMEQNASIIGLSALMTTTMQEMKQVIELVKEKGCSSKVIIGGAVITQTYADEIGADGFSKDASEAVQLVKRLIG